MKISLYKIIQKNLLGGVVTPRDAFWVSEKSYFFAYRCSNTVYFLPIGVVTPWRNQLT